MTEPVFSALERDCMAEGVILFTLSRVDESSALTHRIHTSHPVEYPLGGVKPMQRDAWYEVCITAQAPFVANTPAEFATLFPDYGQISAMGLGSCVNLPVIGQEGRVIGTVNLLAKAGHFAPARLAACVAHVARHSDGLVRAILGGD